jgi:hypothetical protein
MRTIEGRSSGAAMPPTAPVARRYLLFAGREDTRGGLCDLQGVFDDEAEARRAFAELRLRSEPSVAWGELGAVDAGGDVALLCWFGHDRAVPGRRRAKDAQAAGIVPAPDRRRRAWGRHGRRRLGR